MRKFKHFVGIDTSKNKLDIAVFEGKVFLSHTVLDNSPASIKNFIVGLKQSLPGFMVAKAVFGMEETGIYNNFLKLALKQLKAHIVIESATQIKNSLGTLRGKYDKIDAIRIANYLYKSREELRFWQSRRIEVERLANLSTLRSRLVATKQAFETPLKEQREFANKAIHNEASILCNATINSVLGDISAVDLAMYAIIEGDSQLLRLMEIITSVPCVGRITAIGIIVATNEFKDISDPKKFACYSGVAPFKKESGTIVRKAQVSPIANKQMKALMHTCAMAAVSYKGELRTYYRRKIDVEGKAKMAVLNAVRYKLILRVFACVKQNRTFVKDYVRSKAFETME